jgi:hypothetical protein
MKQHNERNKPWASRPLGKLAEEQTRDYSTLVVIGAVLALALLSGCASTSGSGGTGPYDYNPVTGYPAVGHDGTPWHL